MKHLCLLYVPAIRQPDDLSFQKNDIIVITQKENEHWFRGFVQSDPSARIGLFPSNVRQLSYAISKRTVKTNTHLLTDVQYVEPYSGDQASGYTPSAHSYYAPSTVSNDPEKAALQPYNMQASSAQYYSQPPPQQQYYQQPPAGPQAPSPAEPGKKNKFKMPGSGNGFGSTLAHAGVGGADHYRVYHVLQLADFSFAVFFSQVSALVQAAQSPQTSSTLSSSYRINFQNRSRAATRVLTRALRLCTYSTCTHGI